MILSCWGRYLDNSNTEAYEIAERFGLHLASAGRIVSARMLPSEN